ncbi:uncharacterized protein CXQ87_000619 [Candidozyma duobushaemuli]|uniref:Lysophospholipase n=1 Tax=Candidozyma duobushaemuli TaxID=1231522 RepID=A0A2V1AJ13_9ASCO|nr:uncharacterized protein CXQ87_000619 [[Candida] duobushaemulonis]PVH17725.1 hypothetical protein CXQ87_000619 [[Candida] duobushaemulonis]
MLLGAGVLSAYDARDLDSQDKLGGLLQSTTYIAGLSGGSWIVMNNLLSNGEQMHTTIRRLELDLQNPLLEGVPNLELKDLRAGIESNQNRTHQTESPDNAFGALIGKILPGIVSKVLSVNKNDSPINVKEVLKFYKDVSLETRVKKESGFRISLIDYWARILARKVFPPNFRSTGYTMSSTSKLLSFQNYSQPFPIITAVEVVPEVEEGSADSHIIEITPFEFGSWDSFLNAFTDIKFLGSNLSNGRPIQESLPNSNESTCTSGFDSLAFLTATSSGLFNIVLQYVYKSLPSSMSESSPYFSQLLKIFGFVKSPVMDEKAYSEFAIHSPNPFYNHVGGNIKGRSIINSTALFLADGGEDGQNIPFSPLMISSRQVDALIVFDMGSEVFNRPNGSSLIATAKRYHANYSDLRIPLFQDKSGLNRRIFPMIPTSEEYLERGFQERPVFFGCSMGDYPSYNGNLSNQFEIQRDFIPPLIIYQANYDISFPSNTSTFRTSYQPEEVQGMVRNGYNLANHDEDPNYKHCLWCAISKRKKISMISFTSGVICGLVVFTPAGGYISSHSSFWKSIVFGVVGGFVGNLATRIKYFLRIDDALDIFAVHGVCGVVGTILVGIFADESFESSGGWVVGNWIQLGYQILGCVVTSLYAFVVSLALLYIIDMIPGLHLRIDKSFNRRMRNKLLDRHGSEEGDLSSLDNDFGLERAELLGTDWNELNGEYSMDFMEFIKVVDPQDYADQISAEPISPEESDFSQFDISDAQLRKREPLMERHR